MRKVLAVATAATLLCSAMQAQGAVFSWTITGPSGLSGSGEFTTTDVPYSYPDPDDIYDVNQGHAYLLTSFTGTFAGKTVQLLASAPDAEPFYADNLFYPTGYNPFMDLNGWTFETVKSDGTVIQAYNLFDDHICGGDSGGCYEQAQIGYPGVFPGSKNVTFSYSVITPIPVATVPEPASWALMLGGFGLVGAALRSRRKGAIALG